MEVGKRLAIGKNGFGGTGSAQQKGNKEGEQR